MVLDYILVECELPPTIILNHRDLCSITGMDSYDGIVYFILHI